MNQGAFMGRSLGTLGIDRNLEMKAWIRRGSSNDIHWTGCTVGGKVSWFQASWPSSGCCLKKIHQACKISIGPYLVGGYSTC